MTFVPGFPVDLAAVKTATKRAGFELLRAEIEVVGPVARTTVQETEALALRLGSRSQEILILPGDTQDSRTKFREAARWAGEAGELLRIRGPAHAHPSGRIAITIQSFAVAGGRD